MDSESLEKLHELAYLSHNWALLNSHKFHCDESLAGMCAIASGHLHKSLQDSGIESKLAINEEHVFVISSGYVIDITASQFGKDPVYIVGLDKVEGEPWYICEELNTVSELRQCQIDNGWPENQLVLIDGD